MKLGFWEHPSSTFENFSMCYIFHMFCDIVVHKYFESNNNATFNTYRECIASKFEIFPISWLLCTQVSSW